MAEYLFKKKQIKDFVESEAFVHAPDGQISPAHPYGNNVDNVDYSSILGGSNNVIGGASGDHNVIGGGTNNSINYGAFSGILGGNNNDIYTGSNNFAIGSQNQIIGTNQMYHHNMQAIGYGNSTSNSHTAGATGDSYDQRLVGVGNVFQTTIGGNEFGYFFENHIGGSANTMSGTSYPNGNETVGYYASLTMRNNNVYGGYNSNFGITVGGSGTVTARNNNLFGNSFSNFSIAADIGPATITTSLFGGNTLVGNSFFNGLTTNVLPDSSTIVGTSSVNMFLQNTGNIPVIASRTAMFGSSYVNFVTNDTGVSYITDNLFLGGRQNQFISSDSDLKFNTVIGGRYNQMIANTYDFNYNLLIGSKSTQLLGGTANTVHNTFLGGIQNQVIDSSYSTFIGDYNTAVNSSTRVLGNSNQVLNNVNSYIIGYSNQSLYANRSFFLGNSIQAATASTTIDYSFNIGAGSQWLANQSGTGTLNFTNNMNVSPYSGVFVANAVGGGDVYLANNSTFGARLSSPHGFTISSNGDSALYGVANTLISSLVNVTSNAGYGGVGSYSTFFNFNNFIGLQGSAYFGYYSYNSTFDNNFSLGGQLNFSASPGIPVQYAFTCNTLIGCPLVAIESPYNAYNTWGGGSLAFSNTTGMLGATSFGRGQLFNASYAFVAGKGGVAFSDFSAVVTGYQAFVIQSNYSFIGTGYNISINNDPFSGIITGKYGGIQGSGATFNGMFTFYGSTIYASQFSFAGATYYSGVAYALSGFIGAGFNNTISGGAFNSILNGAYNAIPSYAQGASIISGTYNSIIQAGDPEFPSATGWNSVAMGYGAMGFYANSIAQSGYYDSVRGRGANQMELAVATSRCLYTTPDSLSFDKQNGGVLFYINRGPSQAFSLYAYGRIHSRQTTNRGGGFPVGSGGFMDIDIAARFGAASSINTNVTNSLGGAGVNYFSAITVVNNAGVQYYLSVNVGFQNQSANNDSVQTGRFEIIRQLD